VVVPLVALLLCLWWISCAGEDRGVAPRGSPPRIVSLAPSLTELLFELGAGDQVVGVTSMCDRPAAARTKPQVGDSKAVSLESIAALQPDLVLVNSELLVESLSPLASRVDVRLVRTDNIALVLAAVLSVGEAVGRSAAAQALHQRLESAIARAKRDAADRASTAVLFVIQHNPFFVAGPGSYVDELLGVLGYRNAAAQLEGHWPCISEEAMLTLEPDVIVDAALERASIENGDGALLARWRRYRSLPAVRSGRITTLRDPVVVRPGPALESALQALERTIGGAVPAAAADRRR
jgi:iron complex transport system substrate-binding protein